MSAAFTSSTAPSPMASLAQATISRSAEKGSAAVAMSETRFAPAWLGLPREGGYRGGIELEGVFAACAVRLRERAEGAVHGAGVGVHADLPVDEGTVLRDPAAQVEGDLVDYQRRGRLGVEGEQAGHLAARQPAALRGLACERHRLIVHDVPPSSRAARPCAQRRADDRYFELPL